MLVNKGEMSPKPSVLRFLKSDMLNAHSVIFHHGLELYSIKATSKYEHHFFNMMTLKHILTVSVA